MQRVARLLAAAVVLTIGSVAAIAGAMGAASAQDAERRIIDVLEVSGLVDPIQVDSIVEHLERAERDGSTAFIIQLNSPGIAVSDAEFATLLQTIAESPVVTAVWVGQAGSKATGPAALMVTATDVSGIAPGSKIGDIGDDFDGVTLPAPFDQFTDRRAEGVDAVAKDLVDAFAPTLGDMVLALEDLAVVDQLAEVVDPDAAVPQRQLLDDVTVRFNKLGLADQLMHTVASPAVAYLLLLVGLTMILLDFYTAGIGVAGVTGAISLLLAAYGLGVLDASWLGIVGIGVSMFAFAIDVQTGVPRLWTIIGTIALVTGTFTLLPDHSIGWIPIVSGIGLTLAFVLSGMPALVRTRFSTTTIGREWMIGLMGTAVTSIDPDGTVMVQEAQWRARTNRLTPIDAGQPARVVSIEGTVLEVEPEEGGAIDYREMRGRSSD